MRIAVSDFDGTLATRGKCIGDVVPAVQAWRQAGNLFGIATGRDGNMIRFGLEQCGIPVDFVICLSGAHAYDADGAVLFDTLLDDDLVPALVRHPAADASTHIQLSGSFLTKAVLRKESWFGKIGISFDQINEDAAVLVKNVGQISLAFHSDEEALGWKEVLLRDFPGRLAVHPNRISIDINAHGVDKAEGIARFLRVKGWEDAPVHVIGDGLNDVPMLRRFGGYTLDEAPDSVKAEARHTFPDVPAMLRAFG